MSHWPPWQAGATGRAPRPGQLSIHSRRGQYICLWALLPPAHIQECLHMVINWTPANGCISCQVHPGPAHEPWPLSSRQKVQGSTKCC